MEIKIGNVYKVKKGRYISLDFDFDNDVELRGETSNCASLTDTFQEGWRLIDIVKHYDGNIDYLKLEDEDKQWVYVDLETFKHLFKEACQNFE